MKFIFSMTLTTLTILSTTAAVAEDAVYELQKKMLFQPSEHMIANEIQNNRISIYEGMKLADVERAMDEQFDRIDNMMFIRTRVPVDGDAHTEVAEKDGCD